MSNTINNVSELLGAFQFEGTLENTDQLHDGHIVRVAGKIGAVIGHAIVIISDMRLAGLQN